MVEAAPPTEALAEACQYASALAWQAGQAQQECGLDILPDEFVRSTLRFGLVEARRRPAASEAMGNRQLPHRLGRLARSTEMRLNVCRTCVALIYAFNGYLRGCPPAVIIAVVM